MKIMEVQNKQWKIMAQVAHMTGWDYDLDCLEITDLPMLPMLWMEENNQLDVSSGLNQFLLVGNW